jgi:hypothetical protein
LSGDTGLGPSSLLLAFLLQDHGDPALLCRDVSADSLNKDLHPALLLLACVGVEVNDLAVCKADPEALFDEHVAFFIFSKARLATTATLCGGRLLKRPLVVEKLGGLRQVDCGSRLPSALVVGCEFGAFEAEVTTTPVL